MSGPPRPRPDVRVRRHLAWFVPEAGGVALDAAGRLPVQEVGWCFPPDVDDLIWPGAAPGGVAALACLARVDVAGLDQALAVSGDHPSARDFSIAIQTIIAPKSGFAMMSARV